MRVSDVFTANLTPTPAPTDRDDWRHHRDHGRHRRGHWGWWRDRWGHPRRSWHWDD